MVMKLKMRKESLAFTSDETEVLRSAYELHRGNPPCCEKHLLQWCMHYLVCQAEWDLEDAEFEAEQAAGDVADEPSSAGGSKPLAG